MMAVGLTQAEVQPYLADVKDEEPVVVACCNSPQSLTLSGHRKLLEALSERFVQDGIFARMLKVELAYHSPYMLAIAEEYQRTIQHLRPASAGNGVAMISTVTGTPIEPAQLDAAYWVRNMCSPVLFAQALETSLSTPTGGTSNDSKLPSSTLEVGPHGALQAPIRQLLTEKDLTHKISYTSVLTRGKDALISSMEAAGALWCRGHNVDLGKVNEGKGQSRPQRVLRDLPPYPWK